MATLKRKHCLQGRCCHDNRGILGHGWACMRTEGSAFSWSSPIGGGWEWSSEERDCTWRAAFSLTLSASV